MKLTKLPLIVIHVLLLTLTLLLLALLPFNVKAQTSLPVLNVNTGLGYATIQEAIDADATLNGNTIHVDVGTYYENVVVDKSVSLIGENKFSTIIDGQASGNVITITASNVNVTGFTVRNSKFGYGGIDVYQSNSDNVSGNIAENNYDGILFYGSNDGTISGNSVQGNEYGIRLHGSSNVNVSGNAASTNMNGIHLDVASNNTVVSNDASSNSGNGIYLYGSSNNTLLGNDLFSNLGRGIRLQYSYNNTLLSNIASGSEYGIDFYGSGDNIISNDVASFNNQSGMLLFYSAENTITSSDISNNTVGIWLINSDGSEVSANNVSSNSQFGIRLWNSSNNVFFHNNFVKNVFQNVEQPTNTSILNLWDYDGEGNFWGDYNTASASVNGIGDTPYIVDNRTYFGVYSQDISPLMGPYSQFTAAVANQSYIVMFVSNSTISGFQYNQGLDNTSSTLSFEANGSEGQGFCRIAIPTILFASPYSVTADNAPLQYIMARTNGTYTWMYFSFTLPGHEVAITVAPLLPPETPIWYQWWFWGISGLALVGVVLGGFAIRYRKTVVEQTKILQAYSPFVVAEALFKADIERRGLKIKEFEEKYRVKIQPKSTLEDVIRSMEAKEKEEKT